MNSASHGRSSHPSSGKTAKDENFPVASWLLAARHRIHVRTFYRFARAIDDIADSPDLGRSDKLVALRAFGRSVGDNDNDSLAYAAAHAMRESLEETRITPEHCRDLVRAFEQDATKDRYASWEELMDYCILSAAPVGRYLIDLHGGPLQAYPASDALCSALQVLNHLQDCGQDYCALDRVYLPQDWMQLEEVPCAALDAAGMTPALRCVQDRCLEGIDRLLVEAAPLPIQLKSVRLAMEASAIQTIARTLVKELKRRDPLAERVVLSPIQYAFCILRGVASAAWLRLIRCTQTTRKATSASAT